MSVNTKMKAIADEVRELSGTTEALGLDAMAIYVGEANNEVDSQAELLAQAIAALEGKAAGGGSGGGSNTQSKTVSLQVKKITSDTYANETTYTGEQFILLDIYPKTNGTVSVTYGGLTKTITDTSGAAEPTSQKVFFGTFGGVSDTVETPSSGELTIEGDYCGFACGNYNQAKTMVTHCACIISANSLGNSTEIYAYAFYNATDLTSIEIPDSVTRIAEFAFSDCSALTSIHIPGSVNFIERSAFYNCKNLVYVSIGDGVTSIANEAFVSCNSLSVIFIPRSINNIGIAFRYCSNLSHILVDYRNETYHSNGNCIIETSSKTLITGCKTSVIPNDGSVTSIGSHAFNGCTNLTSITIPDSVISIGDNAFHSCTNLTSVEVSNGVVSIGNHAFDSCTNLTSITIPDSVTSIGSHAFNGCTNLTSITIPDSVTSIGNAAFYLNETTAVRSVNMLSAIPATLGGTSVFDVKGANFISVPAGSGDAYKAAENWSIWADYILEVS